MRNAFFPSFLILILFFLLRNSFVKLLVLRYKIVVHKIEIQKCKYLGLGHVSFIDLVWCFFVQQTVLQVSFNGKKINNLICKETKAHNKTKARRSFETNLYFNLEKVVAIF